MCGQAKQGKSSLINAIAGVEVAKVGTTGRTTKNPLPIKHPDNPNVTFWDLPGIDGVEFKQDNYFEKIENKQNDYDFFLIVTKDTFSSDALFLTEELDKLKKSFFLVRTHVDRTIEEAIEKKEIATQQEGLENIREDLRAGTGKPIYLVNTKKRDLFDMPTLLEACCDHGFTSSLRIAKRQAFLFTVRAATASMHEKIYEMFKDRLTLIALKSALVGLVPIPGPGIVVDVKLICEEVINYIRTFGLDARAIALLEKTTGKPEGSIESEVQRLTKSSNELIGFSRLQDHSQPIATAVILSVRELTPIIVRSLAVVAASEAMETTAKTVLPIIGSFLIASPLSFVSTRLQLSFILDDVKKIADAVIRQI